MKHKTNPYKYTPLKISKKGEDDIFVWRIPPRMAFNALKRLEKWLESLSVVIDIAYDIDMDKSYFVVENPDDDFDLDIYSLDYGSFVVSQGDKIYVLCGPELCTKFKIQENIVPVDNNEE